MDHVQRSVSFRKRDERAACTQSSGLRPLGLVGRSVRQGAYSVHSHSLTLGSVLFQRVVSEHVSRLCFSRKLVSSVSCASKSAEHAKNTPFVLKS